MSINYRRLMVFNLVPICGLSVQALGQQPTRTTAAIMITYDGDMAALLAQLAKTYDLTIGLELYPGSAAQVKSASRLHVRRHNECGCEIGSSLPVARWKWLVRFFRARHQSFAGHDHVPSK